MEDATLCSGSNISLTATGFGTKTWYVLGNATPLTNTLVSPTNTTTYVVKSENGVCPATYDTVLVNVDVQPSAVAMSDISICQGSSTSLESSGFGTSSWYLLGSSTALTNTLVSPTSTTTYIVKYENGVCAPVFDTVSVMVEEQLGQIGIISGQNEVCSGDNIFEYSIPSVENANSYHWILPNGFEGISDSEIILIQFLASSNSSQIQVFASNSCGNSDTVSLFVIVNHKPQATGVISGDAMVCQAETDVEYTVLPFQGATLYHWILPNDFVGSSDTPSILLSFNAAAQTGTIGVFGSNECGNSDTIYKQIDVIEKPLTPVITLVGNTLISNYSMGNQWYDENGLISNATNQEYVVTQNGEYYSIVTINGCSSDPSNRINVTLSKIDNHDAATFVNVYPSPFSYEINIQIDGTGDVANFDIYNALGQIVYQGEVVKNTMVNTINFPRGVYFIKLVNKDNIQMFKVIKN